MVKQESAAGIYYRCKEAFDPQRETLLFVHGAGGNGLFWAAQIEHFSDRYNVMAIDLPGHDDQGTKGRDSIEAYVEDIKTLLDGLGVEDLVLGGLSMGGAITQQFTLSHPDMVKAALLISTGARLGVMPLIFETVRKDFGAFVEMMGKFSCSQSTPAELIAPVHEELKKRDPDVVYHDFEACNKFDVRSRLAEIRVPVLIVHGLDDSLTPTKYHDYLSQAIAGSKMVKIEKAGPMVPVERPSEVNSAIRDFLVSV